MFAASPFPCSFWELKVLSLTTVRQDERSDNSFNSFNSYISRSEMMLFVGRKGSFRGAKRVISWSEKIAFV